MRIHDRTMPWLWAGLCGTVWGLLALAPFCRAQEKPKISTVDRGDVVERVVERGVVEAVNTVDVTCGVRARTAGGAASSITWLAEDGSMVKKGDRIAELDSAAARAAVAERAIALAQAEAGLAAAAADLKLTQARGRLEELAATAAAELADLDRADLVKGRDIARREAELQVKRAELAVALAKRAADRKPEEESKLEVDVAAAGLESSRLHLKQLVEAEPAARRRAELRLQVARQEAEVVKLKAARDADRAGAAVAAARAGVDAVQAMLSVLKQDLDRCTMTAPMDGVLVYAAADQGRRGPGGIIAVGEPVREGQIIFRICDLSKMQVVTRIGEAQIVRVRRGQAAQVRVDAFPNRVLDGQVTDVGTRADHDAWVRQNVRVYPVWLSVSSDAPRLKPGMSADAAIVLRERKNVLRVPTTAVTWEGRIASCHLMLANGKVHARPVGVGANDGKYCEITLGLQEGDTVLTQPPGPKP